MEITIANASFSQSQNSKQISMGLLKDTFFFFPLWRWFLPNWSGELEQHGKWNEDDWKAAVHIIFLARG